MTIIADGCKINDDQLKYFSGLSALNNLILNNTPGGFLQKAIRVFSHGKPLTHTAVGFFPFVDGPTTGNIFEADLLVCVSDWADCLQNPHYDLKVYRWASPPSNLSAVLWDVHHRFNLRVYGGMQFPYYMWRWLVEVLHLPCRWAIKNFFPKNAVCTGIVFTVLQLVQDDYCRDAIARNGRNVFTCRPDDIEAICDDMQQHGHMVAVFEQQHQKAK